MDQRLDDRGGGWVGGGPESGPSQVSQTRRKPTKPITGILVRIRSASLRSGLGCRRYGGLRSSDAVPPGEVRLCARLGQPASGAEEYRQDDPAAGMHWGPPGWSGAAAVVACLVRLA